MIELGDMTVLFTPDALPAKVWKALAVISSELHPSYDRDTGLTGGAKDKCLFTSLAIRDFLVKVGFPDATVRGCALLIRADDLTGKEIWSLGLGVPGQQDRPEKFNGHVVCTIPSLNLLIDTTIYQAQRKHWPTLPGMIAVEYFAPNPDYKLYGLAAFSSAISNLDDRNVAAIWLDRPELKWRQSEDFRIRNERRIAVTKALLQAFNA